MPSEVPGTLRRYGYLLVPCAVILAYALPIVGALLPNNFDELDESYEPAKTLAILVGSKPTGSHWGPMPSFLYAPVYAPFLYFWHRHGDFHRTSGDYPYGFRSPFEQEGTLILLARLTGLGMGLLATGYYGIVLTRAAGSRLAAVVALTVCIATGPDLVYKFVATKPDGLMLAFLAVSMGAYVEIVTEGLTVGRGALLAVSAVASISCKEETAPAYIAMFIWLALKGLRINLAPARRRFFGRYATTLAVGIGAYAVIDVVYAPAAWWAHVQFWTGAGTAPAIWAPPSYSLLAYFADVIRGILYNLGPGGCASVIAALFVTIVWRPKGILASWIPTFGYLILLVLIVRYTARYFLTPVNVLAAFPVALAFAHVERTLSLIAPRYLKRIAIMAALLLCIVSLWSGNVAWVRLDQLTPTLEERYSAGQVGKNESIHLANMWRQFPGASRLSNRGFHIDDRPLGELLQRPADLPDVILIDREEETWLRQFKARPARDEFFKASGYSYAEFEGFEVLGYRLTAVIRPQSRRFMRPIWRIWPWYRPAEYRELLVYRRVGLPETER